jgi:hypothetical protein
MKWIKNKWSILGFLSGIWVIFTIAYAFWFITVPLNSSKTFETIKFVFLSISAFGVLFSVLLSSFNSLEATSNIQDRINFDRTGNAFRFFERWDSSSLKDARDMTRAVGKEAKDLSPTEIISRVSNNDDLERSVITMFNFFEEINFAIEEKHVNAKLVEKAFAKSYGNIYKRFESWVEQNIDETQKKHLMDLKRKWNV